MEYFKKGNDYYNEQNYKKAVEIYKKAIKNRDSEIASMYNMALCYIKQEEYNKAIQVLKIAAEKNPTESYFFNLAYAYVMAKNFKKALIYFNRAWALSPEDKDCEIMINHILERYRKGRGVDKFV